ncbi:MAG: TrmH family RNA methyltransferase [Patescibacteria group bacterium]
MLSLAWEKKIKELHKKSGRNKYDLCLVEGQKVIDTAGDAVEFTFTSDDTDVFAKLVTTETPQQIAGVAHIPHFSGEDIQKKDFIVLLDGVQDPGNVGSILRLCLGFNASLVLIDSVDVTNPKVVRSSVGALFHVPWISVKRDESEAFLTSLDRPIYKLEKNDNAVSIQKSSIQKPCIIVAGSEGNGISLEIEGTSIYIEHDEALESLNVTHALAIALNHVHHTV